MKVTKTKVQGIEYKKPVNKTVILCSNGFQNSDIHDSYQFIEYFSRNFKTDFFLCKTIQFSLTLRLVEANYKIQTDCQNQLNRLAFARLLLNQNAYEKAVSEEALSPPQKKNQHLN